MLSESLRNYQYLPISFFLERYCFITDILFTCHPLKPYHSRFILYSQRENLIHRYVVKYLKQKRSKI